MRPALWGSLVYHGRAEPYNKIVRLAGQMALDPSTVKLFRGSRIMELAACGLKLEACRLGLEASYSFLSELGA